MSTRARVLATLAALPVALPAVVRAQALAVRVGSVATESFGGPYIAAQAGYFTKAGLDVELVSFSNGSAIASALVGGAIDVGVADLIQVANAAVRGVPVAFFAGSTLWTTDAPTSWLASSKSAAVQTAKDLEGKTLAAFGLKSISQLAPEEWMRQNGADPSLAKFVELPGAAMAPAVLRGSIAAATIVEPFLSATKSDLRLLTKGYDSIAKRFYLAAFFARRDWLSQKADVARRFTDASFAAARWSNAHHDDTAPIIAAITKLSAEVIRGTVRATYVTSPLDSALMQPVLDVATRYGALDRAVDASTIVATIP